MFKLFVLSLLAISCSGVPVSQNEQEPTVTKQYREEALKYFGQYPVQADPSNFDEKKVRFYLYTREVPAKHEVITGDWETLRNSSYNVKNQLKILIHSWLSTERNANELVTAYLRHHENATNVITVDYSAYTGANYYEFIKLQEKIGQAIGKLVQMLYRYGTHPDFMHVIGLGFGAHLAGSAAHFIAPLKLGRITGLDPIGLGFDQNASLPQLHYNDADFVDIITTNMKELGSEKARGVARFFPNGGVHQPQSDMFLSHYKSYYYFTESVVMRYAYKSYQANSYTDYLLNNTDPYFTYMGEYVNKRSLGNYYLKTNPLPRYGQSEPHGFEVTSYTSMWQNAPSGAVTLMPPTNVQLQTKQQQKYQQGEHQEQYMQQESNGQSKKRLNSSRDAQTTLSRSRNEKRPAEERHEERRISS